MITAFIHKFSTHFGDGYTAKILCLAKCYLWYIIVKLGFNNALEFFAFYSFSSIFG